MVQVHESDDYVILSALLLFTLINFNPEVSIIYQFMVVISMILFFIVRTTKPFPVIPVESVKTNRASAFIWGIGSLAVLLFVSSFLLPMLGFAIYSNPQSILYSTDSSQALFPFSAEPILAKSELMSVLIWGQIIPIVETMYFFGILAQFISHMLKVSFSSWGFWMLMGGIFVLFHMTAKGVTNNEALIVTFLFGVLSMFLINKFRELKQAIILHVTANTLAISNILGIFSLRLFS